MSNRCTTSYFVSATGDQCFPWGVYRGFESDDYRTAEQVAVFVLRTDAERKRSTMHPASRRPLIVRRSNRP